MTDSLAVEYSPQLSYIHSTSAPSSYSDAHFTDCLTYLRLPLDKNAKNILPKIPAQQLEHLSLSDVNEDFSWKYFQPEGSSADLVFNYLKTLVLVFYHQINNAKPEEFAGEWRYQNSNKPLKVHFPKLDYVHLYQAPIDPDILFTDVFPSRLGMIDVCTASIDCRDYNKTSLSNIYYVRFRYLSSEESFSDDFYNETNFFYNQVEVNKYSSLIIENTHSLDISRVTWVNLKGLAFQVVDFDKLMPLLQKPENVTCLYLVKLNTSDFDFADDPATWSIPNSMLTDFAIKRHVKGNSAVSNAPETHTVNPARIHIDGLDQKVVASNIGLAGQIGAARYAKRFNIMQLEYLRLIDVNQNFTWECFQSEDTSSDIVFSSLKTLKFDFYLDSLLSKPDELTGLDEGFYEETNFFFNQVE
ncbi:hypothetical protein GGF39_001147, partial [Coemansia sp. RSA 1721]